jgi:hypothetical protein
MSGNSQCLIFAIRYIIERELCLAGQIWRRVHVRMFALDYTCYLPCKNSTACLCAERDHQIWGRANFKQPLPSCQSCTWNETPERESGTEALVLAANGRSLDCSGVLTLCHEDYAAFCHIHKKRYIIMSFTTRCLINCNRFKLRQIYFIQSKFHVARTYCTCQAK